MTDGADRYKGGLCFRYKSEEAGATTVTIIHNPQNVFPYEVRVGPACHSKWLTYEEAYKRAMSTTRSYT